MSEREKLTNREALERLVEKKRDNAVEAILLDYAVRAITYYLGTGLILPPDKWLSEKRTGNHTAEKTIKLMTDLYRRSGE